MVPPPSTPTRIAVLALQDTPSGYVTLRAVRLLRFFGGGLSCAAVQLGKLPQRFTNMGKIERKQFSELLFQYVAGGEGYEDSGATPTDAARLLRVTQVPGGHAESRPLGLS